MHFTLHQIWKCFSLLCFSLHR